MNGDHDATRGREDGRLSFALDNRVCEQQLRNSTRGERLHLDHCYRINFLPFPTLLVLVTTAGGET